MKVTFQKLLQQQENTKMLLVDVLKESMKTDSEARKEEKEQTTAFLGLLSSVASMLRLPPAAPGPSHWPAYYMPPTPDMPPAAATSPGIPWPPYGLPFSGTPQPLTTSRQMKLTINEHHLFDHFATINLEYHIHV